MYPDYYNYIPEEHWADDERVYLQRVDRSGLPGVYLTFGSTYAALWDHGDVIIETTAEGPVL